MIPAFFTRNHWFYGQHLCDVFIQLTKADVLQFIPALYTARPSRNLAKSSELQGAVPQATAHFTGPLFGNVQAS
jgi:hypothetical protein